MRGKKISTSTSQTNAERLGGQLSDTRFEGARLLRSMGVSVTGPKLRKALKNLAEKAQQGRFF